MGCLLLVHSVNKVFAFSLCSLCIISISSYIRPQYFETLYYHISHGPMSGSGLESVISKHVYVLNVKNTLLKLLWGECHRTTSHYPSQCWPRSISPYSVTWPQLFNSLRCGDACMRYRTETNILSSHRTLLNDHVPVIITVTQSSNNCGSFTKS